MQSSDTNYKCVDTAVSAVCGRDTATSIDSLVGIDRMTENW